MSVLQSCFLEYIRQSFDFCKSSVLVSIVPEMAGLGNRAKLSHKKIMNLINLKN